MIMVYSYKNIPITNWTVNFFFWGGAGLFYQYLVGYDKKDQDPQNCPQERFNIFKYTTQYIHIMIYVFITTIM